MKKFRRPTLLGPCGHPIDRNLNDEADYCQQCEEEANAA